MISAPPPSAASEALSAQFHVLARAAGVGLWWWDFRSNEVFYSPEWKEQLGYADDEIAHTFEEWDRRLHPEDRAPTMQAVADFRAGRRQTYDVEFRLKHKSGAWRWIFARADFTRDANGIPVRMMGCHVDITDRKEAEAALRVSEERLKLALEATRDGLWDWDIATGDVYYSDQWAHLLGYDPAEVPQRVEFFFEILHPDDIPRVESLLDTHLKGLTTVKEDEVRLRTRSGEYRWFLDRGKVTRRDASGKPQRMIGTISDITDRKAAEVALRESERELRLIANMVPGPVARVDSELRYRFVNDHYLRLYRPTREEILGHTIAEVLGEDLFRKVEHHLRASLRGQRVTFEVHYETPAGAPISLLINLVPDVDAEQNVIGFFVVGVEITDRVAAEKALRESEVRWKFAIEGAGDGIWDWDVTRGTVFFSRRWKQMLGYEEHEISNSVDEWKNRVHPGDQERVLEAVKLHLDGRTEQYTTEYRMLAKDGSWKWILDRGLVVARDAEGRPLRMTGTHSDITERKQADERFRLLFESGIQGALVWNLNGGILAANDTFLSMLGYTREELETGKINWLAITPPEWNIVDTNAMEQVIQNGFCTPFEKEYYRKDGSRVPVLLAGASFESNRHEGVSIVIDLTERKKFEQQVLRAQRMESIGTLAGGIAHDFNNVLGPIVMSLELMKRRFTDPGSQELLDLISASSRAGVGMVRRLLSFARGFEGQRVEMHPGYVVNDVSKLATDTFLKSIKVHTEISPDLWTVSADPTQLHQVLLNLAVNARDAMPDGGELTLSATNADLRAPLAGHHGDVPIGRYVTFKVRDTGVGMDANVLERVFDPFFTTKEVGKGTGLGLSTALAIVKGHGGFLRVQSHPGHGTEFQVFLPAILEPAPLAPAPGESEVMLGREELILVADDDNAMRRTAAITLQSYGYRVLAAPDGARALELLLEQRDEVAVAVVDMMMPEMDGAATIRALLRARPDLPIIATSGLCTERNIQKAEAAGARHFLAKPYTAESILTLLAGVIRR